MSSSITTTQVLLITLAGALGVLLRFSADQLMLRFEFQPHIGTFTVNALGCFLAGALYALMASKGTLSPSTSQVLLVGLCGGFTTFSAYALQTLTLAQASSVPTAVIYFIVSPLAGLGAAAIGFTLLR
jgi:fluoride exporter